VLRPESILIRRNKPMNLRSARVVGLTVWVFVFAYTLLDQGRATGQRKDVSVSGDDQTTTIDCNGNAVNVSGDDNNITIQGACSRLAVSGDDNTIIATTLNDVTVTGDDNTISVEAVARIIAIGDDNTITWKKGVGDKRPEISSKGDGNTIKQAN
jgi:hypothetical protein